ncbi:MAG: M13 family metallopeptidase [Lachnospiraceae bacterium]|nr:M13 family metallopeptidase [Lachnospiraceae bacterium]
MKRRILALLLAFTMVFSAGCSATVAMDENGKVTVDGVPVEDLAKDFGINIGEQDETEETGEAEEAESADEENLPAEGGSPWIDSDLKSNIKEDMELSPKDDFHLYLNHDWLLNTEIKEGKRSISSFTEVEDNTDKKALALLNDDSLTSHDAQLVQSLYRAILDWDARDKAGLDPIKDTVKDIQDISSLDEMSDFICDEDRSMFVPTFIWWYNTPSNDDSSEYIMALGTGGLTLGDSAEYKNRTEYGDRAYKAGLTLTKALLTRLDYSEAEAEEVFDDVISFETKIAEKAFTSADQMSPDYIEKTNNVYEPEELSKLTEAFPLTRIMESFKYGDAKRYLVYDPEAIKRLDELYTEENLESIKNCLLVYYLDWVASDLDSEAYDAYIEAKNIRNGSTGREKDEKVAFDIVRSSLPAPMDRLYLEKYDATKKKQQITKICEDVIAVYREMLEGEVWMSDETKEKAIEKLDNITINAVYPEKWIDYSDLDLTGLSLYDCYVQISKFNMELDRSHTNGKVDHELWDFDILEANAYYNPQDNSINLILGLLDEPFYYEGISDEALLGGVGSVIGHEISHAFDTNGAQFDKDGNFVNWWTEEDYKAFKDRADKLVKYYDGITVWDGENARGNNIQTEAIADMAGIKAMLKIAEGKKDFNYEDFFTAYATVWRRLNTRAYEYQNLTQNAHPLHYLRTNVTLQQFDEFHETYDIKEGDNMYLAPEDRILVW